MHDEEVTYVNTVMNSRILNLKVILGSGYRKNFLCGLIMRKVEANCCSLLEDNVNDLSYFQNCNVWSFDEQLQLCVEDW